MFSLHKAEKQIATLRRHWLVLVVQLAPIALVAAAILYMQHMLILGEMWTPAGPVAFPALPEEYIYAGTALFLLILWFVAMHIVTDFYLDVWIITDERIIGIMQQGFFSRKIDSFRIERIQNIQTRIHGLFQTLFGIGDVHVETAGHEHDLIMQTVGGPKRIRDIIMEQVKKRPGNLHDV